MGMAFEGFFGTDDQRLLNEGGFHAEDLLYERAVTEEKVLHCQSPNCTDKRRAAKTILCLFAPFRRAPDDDPEAGRLSRRLPRIRKQALRRDSAASIRLVVGV
ncbi:UNVERIFIED_CONTAM: hypothetical protein K2H54_019402 [Gekko kuhli]